MNTRAAISQKNRELQAIVDSEVAKAQAAYDALPEDQKTNLNRQRPTAINLP